MEYNASKKEIILNRKLNELDKFVLDFIKVLEKHADYVLMSGYVSIVLGRSRATEDVDLFIEKIDMDKFSEIYEDLKANEFICLNAEDPKEVFSYLSDGLAIRFSKKSPIPNMEIKFTKNSLEEETFDDYITLILPEGRIKISSLERQIAFKKYYLGADKDIEDALHIEELFKNELDYEKINKLKKPINIIRRPKNGKNGKH